MSAKYLYGASVQGIQDFIFQTSKLTEIVGASELVEQICTDFFREQVGPTFKTDNLIIGAAGNIIYVFDSREACQQLVMNFPKAVMEMAPGITISQAVVELKDGDKGSTQLLEDRLRVQRNKAISITDGVGLMVMEVARKTGGAGVSFQKGLVIDKAQLLKDEASGIANKKLISKIVGTNNASAADFPFDLSDMLNGDENKSWIAVIHADGNNLGQLIIDIVKASSDAGKTQNAIRSFSNILNDTTISAAKAAYEQIIVPNKKEGRKIPFRPVVLGGDDLTAIIIAELALGYTKIFLKEFEELSKVNFSKFSADNQLATDPFVNGITACAGIAYIKASYPFHYGVKLADALCKEAKNISKKISKKIPADVTPSSLLFHKVHASFVEEYDDIVAAELSAMDNVQFNFGPYFLKAQPDFATIDQLENWVLQINKKDAPKAGLRNWLTALKLNSEDAKHLLERTASINVKYVEKLLLKDSFTIRKAKRIVKGNDEIFDGKFTPVFDIMALSNIQIKQTS